MTNAPTFFTPPRVACRAPLACGHLLVCVLLCCLWATPGTADDDGVRGTAAGQWVQQARLLASDGALGDAFSQSLALSGDTVLVGAPDNDSQGAVYVYVRDGDEWSEQARLVATDGVMFDQFGFAVALFGDIALVGAPQHLVGSNSAQGAVYVFQRSGGVWTQPTKLTAADGAAGDNFGWSVALAGDTALVGAYVADVGGNNNQGAAYVFEHAGGTWSEQARLTVADGEPFDQFGFAVAVAGDTALVGARFANVDGDMSQGAAYVFQRDGGVWDQQARLIADDGVAFDNFGYAVALRGDTALVGAWQADPDDNSNQGAAYVYTRGGETWSQQARLLASDGVPHDQFGSAVALSATQAVVGARSADAFGNSSQGTGYVFVDDGGNWTEVAKLVAAEGAEFDYLGSAAAMDGDTVVLGAPGGPFPPTTGSAYVFLDFEIPPDMGLIEGTIGSLGYCGADGAPLVGVTVAFHGQHGSYSVETGVGGLYQVFLPENESPVSIAVVPPGHLPVTVDDVVFSGGEALVQDIHLVLDSPCATVDPGELELELGANATATMDVAVTNPDSGAVLDWSLATAVPPGAAGLAGVVDCDSTPGLVIHDDGEVDNGYTSGNAAIDTVIFVDRFTPGSYPAEFRAVCVAFVTTGPTSLEAEIVIYAAGSSGPAEELGVLPVTITDIPAWPQSEPHWSSFDLTPLNVVIESGDVFIGVRWRPMAPAAPDALIAAHQDFGSAGRGWWWNDLDGWVPMGVPGSFQPYNALFVRAVENLGGCHAPEALPWLSVDTADGQLAPDQSDILAVDFDTAGLASGEYKASLCLASNDPRRPLIVVPVALTVIADDVFSDRFEL